MSKPQGKVEWAVVSATGRRFAKPDQARAEKAVRELHKHVADLEAKGIVTYHVREVPYRVECRMITAWQPPSPTPNH